MKQFTYREGHSASLMDDAVCPDWTTSPSTMGRVHSLLPSPHTLTQVSRHQFSHCCGQQQHPQEALSNPAAGPPHLQSF